MFSVPQPSPSTGRVSGFSPVDEEGQEEAKFRAVPFRYLIRRVGGTCVAAQSHTGRIHQRHRPLWRKLLIAAAVIFVFVGAPARLAEAKHLACLCIALPTPPDRRLLALDAPVVRHFIARHQDNWMWGRGLALAYGDRLDQRFRTAAVIVDMKYLVAFAKRLVRGVYPATTLDAATRRQGTIDTVIRMIELTTQVDERTYRALERRARHHQRGVSEEAAELLRQALGMDRDMLIAHLQSLHASLKSRVFTPSPELVREDREHR